ncbi:protein LYK2 [Macadamia integrifolia]|uniref:protein LYK2 n=1 Tax=Macadamia integrifolia TaxID=60698 RepID=UPI001C4F0034|nr:protein LYK2 [Macadamia integrifolia]
MATTASKLFLRALLFFIFISFSAQAHSLLSCENNSPEALGYRCNGFGLQDHCETYALFYTNSNYSSLFNLSYYLGLNVTAIADASGFSADTKFLAQNQPLLIPIYCRCDDSFFRAGITKTTIKGESFHGIAESLEGLTTCKAIKEQNPHIPPWDLKDKVQLLIPLRCACPSPLELTQGTRFLLSYPISKGETIPNLASKFNTSAEAIISANNKSGSFKFESPEQFSSLLIPLQNKPILYLFSKTPEPNSGYPVTTIPVINPSKHQSKKSTMWKIVLYIALSGVALGAGVAIAAVILVIQWRKNKPNIFENGDVELQQLSIRTTSEKKSSFEGQQDPFDSQILETTTPHKMVLETYTIDELIRATEDFNSSNLIEGSTFHGRLNGKNLAIKRVPPETISKIDFELFHDTFHYNQPNIIRLLGTCLIDEPDSFLVFEYARNGSLKDWLHGGLAVKSQFIASCYCFLTWNQRLRICLDVANALQYMHNIMNPSYIHRNIKSRNILLDEEFNAKIGNFGMAKCVEDNSEDSHSHSHSQTLSSDPTTWDKGYLAPEYLLQGIVSLSTDIFAYGVVLLEVLSGQTPLTRADDKEEGIVRLSDKINSILMSEDANELRDWMDRALGENYSFDAAVTLANLARSCVEEDPSSRPSAGEIVDKLSILVDELPDSEQISTTCESSSKPQVKSTSSNL